MITYKNYIYDHLPRDEQRRYETASELKFDVEKVKVYIQEFAKNYTQTIQSEDTDDEQVKPKFKFNPQASTIIANMTKIYIAQLIEKARGIQVIESQSDFTRKQVKKENDKINKNCVKKLKYTKDNMKLMSNNLDKVMMKDEPIKARHINLAYLEWDMQYNFFKHKKRNVIDGYIQDKKRYGKLK